MNDSVLQIDVAGYRVVYRVDPRHREVRIVELAKLRRG
jgi:mRNA-degrading endonuclease RelE of RelBE toxin-antitoxin system